MSMKRKFCESCGMPMDKAETHGAGNKDNPYCIYCCDGNGKLKSKRDVREGMIKLFMNEMNKNREEAERTVDKTMEKMMAWKKR